MFGCCDLGVCFGRIVGLVGVAVDFFVGGMILVLGCGFGFDLVWF